MTCGQCGTEIETGTVCPVCSFDNADNAVYTGFLYAETGIRRWVRVFLWISLVLSASYCVDAAYGLLRPTGLLLHSPYPQLLLAVLVLSAAQIVLGILSLQYRLWAVRAFAAVHIVGTILFFFCINYDFEIIIFSVRLLVGVILALSPWQAFGYTSRRVTEEELRQAEDNTIAENILTEEELEEELAEEDRIDEEFEVPAHVSGLGPAALREVLSKSNSSDVPAIPEDEVEAENEETDDLAITTDLPEIIRI